MQLNPEQEKILLEYLAKMQSLIYSPECAEIVKDVTDKDIVIFIGNTRAGKSTIVNHIIGNKLKVIENDMWFDHKIVKENEADSGPIIGLETTSETTIPSAWESSRIDGLIVDAPGFDDNRGEAQDVANAFYIKEMISNANSVKFVLIIDINDIIGDNIAQFINFVDKILTILPNCDSILNGMIAVFNKVKREITKDKMIKCLTRVLKQKMKINNRGLIHHLIQHPEQFVLCQAPNSEQQICETLFANIDIAIQREAEQLPKHRLSDVTPGISLSSKCFLLEARNHFTEFKELDELLMHVESEFIKNVIPSDINNSKKEMSEMKTLKLTMIDAEKQLSLLLDSKTTIKEKLFEVGKYLPFVEELQEGGNIYMKLDFIKFVDELLNIEESDIFHVKVNSAISRMKGEVKKYRIDLQEKMLEMTIEETNELRRQIADQQRKDQADLIKILAEMQQKQMEIIKKNKWKCKIKCCHRNRLRTQSVLFYKVSILYFLL